MRYAWHNSSPQVYAAVRAPLVGSPPPSSSSSRSALPSSTAVTTDAGFTEKRAYKDPMPENGVLN